MSYVASYVHFVWSTKDRRPTITPNIREQLWPFIGGIARENKMTALIVNGVTDHVHALIELPATMSMAKAAQVLKGGSSLWVHRTFPDQRLFAWQEKYAGFTVSVSQIDTLIKYIANQEKHHRERTFQEELLAFLTKHRIKYDPKYLWE